MIQQTAPIVVAALLQSIYAGAIAYAALRIVTGALSSLRPIIKYYLCNILLLIPLIAFVQPLFSLRAVLFAAPVLPSEPYTVVNNIVTTPYTPGIATITASPGASFSVQSLWNDINQAIMEYSNIIMMVYLAGLLLFATRLTMQYITTRRLKTEGIVPATHAWLRLLHTTKKRLKIEGNIQLAFTTRNISPCIIGHAKALILIPVSMANNLNTEQAEAILLHELAHYTQYDHYINIATQCINCILFFNPFAWLIIQHVNNQRELSCDNAAARHDRSIELAETLAMIAHMRLSESNLSLSAGKGGKLLGRIQALLNVQPADNRVNRAIPLAIVGTIATVLLLITANNKIFSTEKDSLKEKLHEISRQMYDEGNFRYVFVDAVADSLVKLPFKGEVLYLGDQYWTMNVSNGYKAITRQQQQQYKEKMKNFLLMNGEDENEPIHFGTLRDNKAITLHDILNETSAFRTITTADRYEAGMTFNAWAVIFTVMKQDGLVKYNMDKFAMEYSGDGISINNKKLVGDMDTKYRRLFRDELGLDLDKKKVSGKMGKADLHKYLVAEQSGSTGWTGEGFNKIEGEMQHMEKHVFAAMHKDGLLDTNLKVMIIHTPEDTWVNEHLLTGAMKEKYNTIFIQDDKELLEHNDFSIVMAHNEQLPYPAYETLDGRKYLRKPDKDEKIKLAKKLEQHEKAMEQHKKALALHDKAVSEHEKALVQHDKALGEHEKALEQHERALEQHYKAVAEHERLLEANEKYRQALKEKEKSKEEQERKKNDKDNKKHGALMDAMKADKLIDDNNYYLVEYKDDGIYINARKLTGEMARKYEPLFELAGYKKGHGTVIEFIPDGLAIPDWESGNSTVHLYSYGDNLPAIADKMFTEGNPKFILAYAIHDGVLKQREAYKYSYKGGVFTWGGRPLPQNLRKKYTRLMNDFMKAHGSSSTQYHTTGGGITVKELNAPSSSIRQDRLSFNEPQGNNDYLRRVVRLMAADNLLDTTRAYSVKYNARGLFVNGEQQGNDITARYEHILIKGMGYKPRPNTGDGVSFSSKLNSPKIG